MSESFSSRQGFSSNPPISIWQDAPAGFRYALTAIVFHDCQQTPFWMRETTCKILCIPPDANNWSYDNVKNEVDYLLNHCEWYKVYDAAEEIFARLTADNTSASGVRRASAFAQTFQTKLNQTMAEMGIGWEMVDGKFEIRGEPVLQTMIDQAKQKLDGLTVAKKELQEAFLALSRRPNPNVSGAIAHACAALESLCRKLTNSGNTTLGDIIKNNRTLFPQPLDQALEKMWGYASHNARHGNEARQLDIHEAYLVVGTIASAIIYVSNRIEGQRASE